MLGCWTKVRFGATGQRGYAEAETWSVDVHSGQRPYGRQPAGRAAHHRRGGRHRHPPAPSA
jgi:hypothetical protein